MVDKAVLAAANPGGSHEDPAAPDIEGKLNNPDTPKMERLALTAPDDAAGKAAVQATIDRIKAAVEAGTMPNDFEVSKQTVERQDRARTTLWKADNSNFEDLKNIKVPVLITDGRSDELDRPKNSLIIANQIPFSWLAYFWGGHSFLYTEPKRFADTVNVFLQ
jgi:pimeloyl-ACP methyl ester carboxylesterase